MSLPTEIYGIYKMTNKTQQKLYFATILDLELRQTPLLLKQAGVILNEPNT